MEKMTTKYTDMPAIETQRLVIKDWYSSKMEAMGNFTPTKYFTDSQIIRVTEKAMLVMLEYDCHGIAEKHFETWIPKFVILTEDEYKAEAATEKDRYQSGCESYAELVAWAKANGVKGVRNKMRRETIMAKIKEAGLTYPPKP
jgi:hypothetical protein